MSSARRVAAPLTVKIVSTTQLFNSYKLNSSSFTIFKSLSLIFISFSKPIIEKRSVKPRIYTEPRDAYATQIHSAVYTNICVYTYTQIYAATTSSAWRRQDLMRWGTVQKTAWNFLSHIKWREIIHWTRFVKPWLNYRSCCAIEEYKCLERQPHNPRTDSTDFTTGPFLLSISVLCF